MKQRGQIFGIQIHTDSFHNDQRGFRGWNLKQKIRIGHIRTDHAVVILFTEIRFPLLNDLREIHIVPHGHRRSHTQISAV